MLMMFVNIDPFERKSNIIKAHPEFNNIKRYLIITLNL